MAKCPKCEQPIQHLTVMPLDGQDQSGEKQFHAVAYLCPNCSAVLGAGRDPVKDANELGSRMADEAQSALESLRDRIDAFLNRKSG